MSLLRPHEKEGKQIFAAAGLKVRCADKAAVEDLVLEGCFLRFATTANDSNVPTSHSKLVVPGRYLIDAHLSSKTQTTNILVRIF
jgi:hypothetical protein